MEKYLNKLLKHYEQSYAVRRATQKDDLIPLDAALMEFVTPRQGDRQTPVSTEFFFQADAARGLVLNLIETRASAEPPPSQIAATPSAQPGSAAAIPMGAGGGGSTR